MSIVNNKRIAKNTLLLYGRLIVLMVISLFTSRVILDSLGVEDFGTYNVVSGFVIMFSMFSAPIVTAIQRFLNFELGRGDKEKLQDVFTTSVNIQIILGLVIVVICESVGLWFLYNKASIPDGRLGAALFVLQCSTATFVINLLNTPYNALIVAHERMNIYAYFGIFEAVAKLGIAYLLYVSPFDKLKLYSSMLFLVSLVLQLSYYFYCKKHFNEAKYKIRFNKALFKEMASITGWSFLGNSAYMLNTQGVNMLLNVFFGVTVNAARAIAVQVDNAVIVFVNGFTTAINPQITKSYAAGEYDNFAKLICRGSKFSFLIMYVLLVPLVLEANTILHLWLKEVPDDTLMFVRLVLFGSLMTCMGNSMYTGVLATGNIKRYQIFVSSVCVLVFPLTWIAYQLGAPAYSTYFIYVIIYFLLNFVRLASLNRLVKFPVKEYLTNVLLRLIIFSVVDFILPYCIMVFMSPSFLRLIIVCVVSVVWSGVCAYYIGLDKTERSHITSIARSRLKAILIH